MTLRILLHRPMFQETDQLAESVWDRILTKGYNRPLANPCPMDITEKPGAYLIQTDAPGLDKSDISITIEGNVLKIKGEHGVEKETEDNGVKHYQQSNRSFYRSLRMPKNADLENIEAFLDKGVLKVVISKKPEAEPKQIEIQ